LKNPLTRLARRLRSDQTIAEKQLWFQLRNYQLLGFKFRRQQVIENYIVDFVCFEKKLVIEVDGGQHQSMTREQDTARTEWLNSRGFRVLRFWNDEILENIDGVMEIIRQTLDDR
jgi:very-short-patch-repair endonuclease